MERGVVKRSGHVIQSRVHSGCGGGKPNPGQEVGAGRSPGASATNLGGRVQGSSLVLTGEYYIFVVR